jgi:hypothetical protein
VGSPRGGIGPMEGQKGIRWCNDTRTISRCSRPACAHSGRRSPSPWHRRSDVTPMGAKWDSRDLRDRFAPIADRQDQASGHPLRPAVSAELIGWWGRGLRAFRPMVVTLAGHQGTSDLGVGGSGPRRVTLTSWSRPLGNMGADTRKRAIEGVSRGGDVPAKGIFAALALSKGIQTSIARPVARVESCETPSKSRAISGCSLHLPTEQAEGRPPP